MAGPAFAPPQNRYTLKDYMTWDDGNRYELHYGVAVMIPPSPGWDHQTQSWNFAEIIGEYLRKNKGPCKARCAPLDVVLVENSQNTEDSKIVYQPDIIMTCKIPVIKNGRFIGAPDLVVEIQSPSSGNVDMNEKFTNYKQFGVREYWVVGMDNTIAKFVFEGGRDEHSLFRFNDLAESTIFPGLNFPVADVFKD